MRMHFRSTKKYTPQEKKEIMRIIVHDKKTIRRLTQEQERIKKMSANDPGYVGNEVKYLGHLKAVAKEDIAFRKSSLKEFG